MLRYIAQLWAPMVRTAEQAMSGTEQFVEVVLRISDVPAG
jgi:hypothetical protein